jgi:hypothetical protein
LPAIAASGIQESIGSSATLLVFGVTGIGKRCPYQMRVAATNIKTGNNIYLSFSLGNIIQVNPTTTMY